MDRGGDREAMRASTANRFAGERASFSLIEQVATGGLGERERKDSEGRREDTRGWWRVTKTQKNKMSDSTDES